MRTPRRRRSSTVAALWFAVSATAGIVGCSDDDLNADGSEADSSGASDADSSSTDDGGSTSDESSTETDSGDGDTSETGPEPWMPEEPFVREVYVTLDGVPVEGAIVAQGGNPARWTTNAEGSAEIIVDPAVAGFTMTVTAAHPEARILGATVVEDPAPMQIDLVRFLTGDNLEYEFQDPGTPEDSATTAKCAHCHRTINADWYDSPHRRSASNPVVQDLYAGVASAFEGEESCVAAGGQWWGGIDPASGESTQRCYMGIGALPDLNADCGDLGSCDEVASEFGDCADCHAPAIDGVLGGRNMLEAGGVSEGVGLVGGMAYQYGVHCDLCHKVNELHLDEKPGVAGRLGILRPLEEQSGVLGPWVPLTFGPYDDVGHVRMGASPRSFFSEATICAGCHELSEAPRLPGAQIDEQRWPDGRLPMHTTYSEWEAGALGGTTPCQACHMPPDPDVLNSADLDNPGIAGAGAGYIRPPGAVRRHVWGGPRTESSGLLDAAGALFVEHQSVAGELEVAVTVRNAGCGHQLPTGEPMRSVMVLVEANCEGTPLLASGGDVIPEFGGARSKKASGEDWSIWPEAQVGQVIRVVSRPGGFVDYQGYGPFGDGSFDALAKGMPVELFVGEATILAVENGVVTLDQALPVGDVAYLGDPVPDAPQGVPNLAGSPGFAFARVLADPDGALMVPHYRAVDVVSDNRLAPQAEWTSLHRFELAGCSDPEVTARLVYRSLPPGLLEERAWDRGDQLMVEVVK